jgi:hypothetical protein
VAREGTEKRSSPGSISGLVVPSPGTWRVEVTLVDELGRAGPPGSLSVPVSAGTAPAGGGARVRLRGSRALVALSPARSARRFGTRVLVGRRVVGAWRRVVPARSRTLIVPVPPPARRAARFQLEWRPPSRGWQRTLVVRPGP